MMAFINCTFTISFLLNIDTKIVSKAFPEKLKEKLLSITTKSTVLWSEEDIANLYLKLKKV